MGDYRTLLAYQKAFALAMRIYHASKTFPAEEKFGLISQIRNSSRSVCVNIVEHTNEEDIKTITFLN
jgi:four helix bundle protein